MGYIPGCVVTLYCTPFLVLVAALTCARKRMQCDSYHYKCLWTSYTSQMLDVDKYVMTGPWYLDHMHWIETNTFFCSLPQEVGLH